MKTMAPAVVLSLWMIGFLEELFGVGFIEEALTLKLSLKGVFLKGFEIGKWR